MRLRRVEAARFGSLLEASLGPLGDGLTVVLGPNEAGKSSFTALVRYILYGFPTRGATSQRPYLSDAGRREGRLVFDSADGEWAVERVEGPHGGASSVRALRGPERPGLVEELTEGVSAEAYRVVFGFGLAEMAEIERVRGADDDIVSRLYAAGAGLKVSPGEVRAAIEAEADALYRPRGSTRVINKLAATARDLRSQLAELEREGEALAADRARFSGLEAALDSARHARDAAMVRSRTLAEEQRALSDLEASIRQSEGELVAVRRAAKEAATAAEAIAVDEAVCGLAQEIAWL
ncbi:MAG TPA: AAA family ATPase, partial [Coriobacteriia bacterium]|nr:AAA family ATPase [Coriobacteriia bacterium]